MTNPRAPGSATGASGIISDQLNGSHPTAAVPVFDTAITEPTDWDRELIAFAEESKPYGDRVRKVRAWYGPISGDPPSVLLVQVARARCALGSTRESSHSVMDRALQRIEGDIQWLAVRKALTEMTNGSDTQGVAGLSGCDVSPDDVEAASAALLAEDDSYPGSLPPGTYPHPEDVAEWILKRARYNAEVAAEVKKLRIKDEAKQVYARERAAIAELGPPMSLADLLAKPADVVQHRIGGLLPLGGRVILAAQAKAGKTTLIGNLIRCLTSGDAFLGRFEVSPVKGNVTLIDTEMPESTISHWLRDQRIIHPERVTVEPLRGKVGAFDILDVPGRQRWAERLKSTNTEVLIFDCLRPLLDAFGLDENTDAGAVLGALDELVARAGVSELVLVHHMGHGPERARGSSRLRDWPDGEWRLLKKDDDPTASRFFAAYGRDVAVPESRLEFDPTTRHLTVVGGSRKAAAVEELMPRLLAELAEHPDLSAKGVEDALAIPNVITRAVVRATLEEGVRDHLVIRQSRGNAKIHRVNSAADLSKSSDLRKHLAGETNSQDQV